MKIFTERIRIILFYSLGMALIVVHGLFTNFLVDYITVFLYAILSVPVLFEYLDRLDLPGGGSIRFRKKFNNLRKDYERQKNRIEEASKKRNKQHFKTFDFSIAYNIVDTDTSLAIASIRMEIERKLRLAYSVLMKKYNKLPLKEIVKGLREKGSIGDRDLNLLMQIIYVCNDVIHGSKITRDEVREILNIAEKLNHALIIGYSINLESNKDFKKHGLECQWEHCIEHMPFSGKGEKSCPIFGHDCPGGEKQVEKCKKEGK